MSPQHQNSTPPSSSPPSGLLAAFIRFFLEQKLVAFLVLAAIILWGVAVVPFDWDPAGKRLRDKKGTGEYAATLLLPGGRHEYKFVVNGEWVIDPRNPELTTNEHGSLNSVLIVEQVTRNGGDS